MLITALPAPPISYVAPQVSPYQTLVLLWADEWWGRYVCMGSRNEVVAMVMMRMRMMVAIVVYAIVTVVYVMVVGIDVVVTVVVTNKLL